MTVPRARDGVVSRRQCTWPYKHQWRRSMVRGDRGSHEALTPDHLSSEAGEAGRDQGGRSSGQGIEGCGAVSWRSTSSDPPTMHRARHDGSPGAREPGRGPRKRFARRGALGGASSRWRDERGARRRGGHRLGELAGGVHRYGKGDTSNERGICALTPARVAASLLSYSASVAFLEVGGGRGVRASRLAEDRARWGLALLPCAEMSWMILSILPC